MDKFERKEETREVKKHLIGLGYQGVKVHHGKGTAWGWLEVVAYIPKPEGCYCTVEEYGVIKRCHYCKNKWGEENVKITRDLMVFTGRNGDYDGNILVELEWI